MKICSNPLPKSVPSVEVVRKKLLEVERYAVQLRAMLTLSELVHGPWNDAPPMCSAGQSYQGGADARR